MVNGEQSLNFPFTSYYSPFTITRLKVKDFLEVFTSDGLTRSIAEKVRDGSAQKIHISHLSGSSDSVIIASVFSLLENSFIIICQDREEAFYVQNDLQNLLPEEDVLLFPASYKKPYKFEEIDNANVLQRAEVLTRINNPEGKYIIVGYPESFSEKVINKKSLRENSFSAKVGDKLDVNFISEFLSSYDFEKTDFVYEAGQYSVRGGIIDVYSYSNEFPFRI